MICFYYFYEYKMCVIDLTFEALEQLARDSEFNDIQFTRY